MAKIETLQEPEPKTSETVSGAHYEIIIKVKGKYDVSHVNRVISAVRTGEGLANMQPFHAVTGYWLIEDIVAESDVWNDVVPFVNTGPSEEWRLRIRATKLEGTPVVVAVGVILALLIVFVGVVGWQAYRIKPVIEDVLNPVVIVGAVLIAALIFGRK